MTRASEADAIKAAINAQFSTPRAFDYSQAAQTPPSADHILVSVSRRYVDDRLVSGEVTIPGGRVTARAVARTIGNAYLLLDRIKAALEDRILPGEIGPFVFETEDPIDDDGEGWFSGAVVWTF